MNPIGGIYLFFRPEKLVEDSFKSKKTCEWPLRVVNMCPLNNFYGF
jgi:hypothetical protein